MTITLIATAVEIELKNLNIEYRKLNFSNGSLLFCTLPNGLTFDLFVGTDRTIKLWSFIGVVSVDRAGMRWEYKNHNKMLPIIGIEVTDDGDLNFYAIQTIDSKDQQKATKICKLIDSYSKIISDANFCHGKL